MPPPLSFDCDRMSADGQLIDAELGLGKHLPPSELVPIGRWIPGQIRAKLEPAPGARTRREAASHAGKVIHSSLAGTYLILSSRLWLSSFTIRLTVDAHRRGASCLNKRALG